MSGGQLSAHVAGGAPGERTSKKALDALLSGRGSLVSLEIFAVLETAPFGALLLTVKLSVIVAMSPEAKLVTEQSMTPPFTEQEKEEVVLAPV